jgi:MarR family transcriptional regulator, organic hydroperoxide resistance regulator
MTERPRTNREWHAPLRSRLSATQVASSLVVVRPNVQEGSNCIKTTRYHSLGFDMTPGSKRRKNTVNPSLDGNELPFRASVGYQIRFTHRLLQRCLRQKIEPYGVTLGMWYFLRALWHRDGQTQRDLSTSVGTMEPTTLTAINSMERSGIVMRVRNSKDRRKINVFLTPRGRRLRKKLLPLARDVVDSAVMGFSQQERKTLLKALIAIQSNLQDQIDGDVYRPD